ncbi:MAG: AlpA family phage regulatory protein [Gammaproteobacteria bacterium]|nr:AlpA family phage regulatory protein [Gammaproteobacteria bacterium]MDE0246448.1 AlpA family phage regulatory protein [Gammaproteobacteria bacterium]
MSRGTGEGPDASPRILRMPEVEARTGLSQRSIRALVARGDFPRPIRLSRRSVGWLESELNGWLLERIARSRDAAE